jgi:nucleotide-binding universal stress UspA family protein
MYKTILLPLDNSASDEAILAHIRPLARLMGSRLVLVHVADGFAAREQKTLNLEESQEIREDRAYLAMRRAELESEGFQVSTELKLGDPAKEILALAEHLSCDLIAMSTHGHGIFKDLILGSVASDVRHRTNIPVLLVRSKRA